jgi:hypothetical protein
MKRTYRCPVCSHHVGTRRLWRRGTLRTHIGDTYGSTVFCDGAGYQPATGVTA